MKQNQEAIGGTPLIHEAPQARSAEGAAGGARRAEPEGRSPEGGARLAEPEGRRQTTSGRFNIKLKWKSANNQWKVQCIKPITVEGSILS